MKFLLGNRRADGGQDSNPDSDASDEGGEAQAKTLKEIMTGFKAGKKTAKRQKHMEKAKMHLSKVMKKKREKRSDRDCNIVAMQQLHDPQEFAERLFRK